MLEEILANKRRELEAFADVDASSLRPSERDFAAALTVPGLSIIAEVKRRSPSAGAMRAELDAVDQALRYIEGGARAISILTDKAYFGGDWADLESVREAVSVPLLCKEFILDARQVRRARAAGADACLLIVAALDDEQLAGLMREIRSLGMDALVEVHEEVELERAMAAGVEIVGVNNRNLKTMAVDLSTVECLARHVPSDRILVAESGYSSAVDVGSLPDTVNAVLAGSAFVRSDDPAGTIREWMGACEMRGARP